ncbi:MAG: ribonuclease HII [Armatimonadota bacterium]|nr:ribonuclease HII [Armatimonadota bacterium]
MAAPLRPADLRALSVAEIALRLRALPELNGAVLRALARDPRTGVRQLAARYRRRQAGRLREDARLGGLRTIEERHRAEGFEIIAGVDEAGVAPLAGPVVAAAVVLPADLRLPGLNDSKRLTAGQREALYAEILRQAAAVALGRAEVEEIDRLNILQATRLAHRRAILALPRRPHLVLIDGRYPADVPVPQLAIVDGDATCASIAAASIVAKVTRDRIMADLATRYPGYGFDVHKGYATAAHRAAILRLGITPVHRRSFLFVQGLQQRLAIG